MASVLPTLTASLNPRQRGGRAGRHLRKASLPEQHIVRLKSFAFTLSESVSPSPDVSFSDRYAPLSASRGQRSDMRFRHQAKAVLSLSDSKPTTTEVACQTYPKASHASPRKGSLHPLTEELLRLDESLDRTEVAQLNGNPHEGRPEAYLRCLEELILRVKRSDERLAGLLMRIAAGLRKEESSLSAVLRAENLPKDCSPAPDPRSDSAVQTTPQTPPLKSHSSDSYPAFATAQDALLRLRTMKYSGVSTKLTELHRALSKLTTVVPEASLPFLPSAAEPSEFSSELTETLRGIQRDVAHALMLKNRKPAVAAVGTQADDQSVNLKELFRLEEAVKERDLDLAKLRNELIDAKVTKDSAKDQSEKQKQRSFELEEKSTRLDLELKALKKKDAGLTNTISDLQQQTKAYEGRLDSAKQLQTHLISMLYSTGDRARKAEKAALESEEALAQARVVQNFTEQRMRLEAGGKPGGERLDQQMKLALSQIATEYDAKKEEMRRRHKLMEQEFQEQVTKVDALLDTATKLLKPSQPQQAKVPKTKARVEARKELLSEEEEEEEEEKIPQGGGVRIAKGKKTSAKVIASASSSSSELEESQPAPVLRSPTRSPTRKTTLVSPSSPALKEMPDRSSLKQRETAENELRVGGEGGRVGEMGGNEGSLGVWAQTEKQNLMSVSVEAPLVKGEGLGDLPESESIDPLDAFAAESAAEERELLSQLSPSECEVFYKVKALFEHQSVWEKAVRASVSSKAIQVGDSPLRSRTTSRPPQLTSIFEEDVELKNWPKEIEETGEMSPTTRRKYQFAVWRALAGHNDGCQHMCKHLRRAMKVRRKVRGLLVPLRVVTLQYVPHLAVI